MMAAASVFFGFSISEVVIIGIGVGYVVSLVRDWRPMKALRQENRDLRDDLDAANKKIADLETEVGNLKKATDLTALHQGQTATVDALRALVDEVKLLDSSMHQNTEEIKVAAQAAADAARSAAAILAAQASSTRERTA